MKKRISRVVFGLAAIAVCALGGAALASGGSGSGDAGYSLDDGGSLKPQAGITIESAVRAAQRSASGDIGEIDLEFFDGKLVYNVDVGSLDVKVDASSGSVLGRAHDD